MSSSKGESNGAPGWNRTSDPELRRLVLYPTELRAHVLTREKRSDGKPSGNGASDFPFGRGGHAPEAVLLRTK